MTAAAGSQSKDSVVLKDLELKTASSSKSEESIFVSAKVDLDVREAASRDDVELTIDYKRLHDTLLDAVEDSGSVSFDSLGYTLAGAAFGAFPKLLAIQLELRKRCSGYDCGYRGEFNSLQEDRVEEFYIENWDTKCLIGVYDWERNRPQRVILNFHLYEPRLYLAVTQSSQLMAKLSKVFPDVKLLTELRLTGSQALDASSYFTLEALASELAEIALDSSSSVSQTADSVKVKATKPEALANGKATIEVFRSTESRPSNHSRSSSISSTSSPSLIVLSVGSNIPPRFANIERALRMLEENQSDMRILDTSFMYDTAPMYVTDQNRFANCALLVSYNRYVMTALTALIRWKAD
jgi:dihydroneopterin aldolase / 2-amino-4-hydroxy-6-hydroxymethyldihydropteridine diphosphokinase / dihydropteroate synthase